MKPGQRIIYGKYSAREFELDREMIVLVREEDVLGIVEETQLAEKKPFAVAEKQENPIAKKKKQTAKKPLAKGKASPKK